MPLTKEEYYEVAAQMQADELPPEIKEKLDAIYASLDLRQDADEIKPA